MAVAAAAIAVSLTVCSPALAGGRTLWLQNETTVLSDAQLQDALPALQASVSQDFAPAWGVDAQLEVTAVVPPGGMSLELVDNPECWFCAGYHDILAGAPHGQVGVDGGPGYEWTITADHEIKELLADPFINRGMLISPRAGAKPKWYALEVCDPVEGDPLAYTRPGASGEPVYLSDFILESWFRRGSKGPWDFTGKIRRPLQILKDGYQLVWSGSAWTELGRGARHN